MWPGVILHFLFTLPPSFFSAMSIASFLYGNGVKCAMAIRLAQVCNATSTDTLQTDPRPIYRMDQQQQTPFNDIVEHAHPEFCVAQNPHLAAERGCGLC